ncbi:MAG: spore maturation protein [Peptococcaceae bacterium]|jgi:spore maturation protein B|nr:spore maturation protein [Peptococcaceae bacterium]MDH7525932.1 spore maturation protein [Peptococcaceae bacterium]
MGSVFREVSLWAVPAFLFLVPVYAFFRGVRVYEAFIRGAEEGFGIAVRIIPYLVAMMMAVSIFRQAGAMDLLSHVLGPVFRAARIPAEVVPLALMRPFSGGGALGVAAELINSYGPDSLIGRMASTMQGSTDTTFFVLTVYFGSVGIKQYRYSLAVGLIADLTTFLASVYIVNTVFG